MINFDIITYRVVDIGPFEIWITDTVLGTAGIMILLIIFAIIVRIKLRKFQEVPTGLQNIVEFAVEAFEKFTIDSVGAKLGWIGGWFFTVFIFLLVANMSGLVSFIRPPTADWSLTLALALLSVLMMQALGAWYRGWEWVKGFFKPFFIFFPINILGELAKPVSLSFRLFGNVLGGMIVVSLVYALLPFALALILPAVLHIYFDIISGVLQAFVFTVLSITYVGLAANEVE